MFVCVRVCINPNSGVSVSWANEVSIASIKKKEFELGQPNISVGPRKESRGKNFSCFIGFVTLRFLSG